MVAAATVVQLQYTVIDVVNILCVVPGSTPAQGKELE